MASPTLSLKPEFRRPKDAHKGDFGHVLVIAGSPGKMGAGLLASRGALRVGAGLVTYALPKEAFEKFDPNFAEVMIEELSPDRIPELINGKSAIVMGPGMGVSDTTTAIVKTVLTIATVPIVIDADALNTIADHPELLPLLADHCILTPHPGEMARLIHSTSDAVQAHRLDCVLQFTQKHPVTLVLKGHNTIVSYRGDSWINPTGNPGMATAGMGDVLSGVIGGLLSQGLPPQSAACTGVYVHGLAGDHVAAEKGGQGLLATDVADAIPLAIHQVQQC